MVKPKSFVLFLFFNSKTKTDPGKEKESRKVLEGEQDIKLRVCENS